MTKPPVPFAPETLLRRNPRLQAVEMDGQTVMMDTQQGSYFALDEVGGALWEALEQPTTLAAAIDYIAERFDAPDRTELVSDIEAFLAQLMERELVQSVDPS